ncbi:MAG: histidine phosphatase family protein [Acidobacteriota bacterium]
MIELYLIRHAVAEERGDAWPDDSRRPLSKKGIAQWREAVRGLVELGVSFDVVATSPFVRTRQTAQLLADVFDAPPPLLTIDALVPGGSGMAAVTYLGAHAHGRRFAVVGHEPGIGRLAARLLGARRAMLFKKGAVCRIDVDGLPPGGAGELRWFLPPKVLRRLR